MTSWKPHRHVGAYGICVDQGKLLVIHKARGPFKGLWDLPGGTIEHGESPEQAVLREFQEETGLPVRTMGLIPPFSHLSRYITANGTPEEVHHLGFLYLVAPVQGGTLIKAGPDGLDSLGARWLPLSELTNLSPLAEHGVSVWPNR